HPGAPGELGDGEACRRLEVLPDGLGDPALGRAQLLLDPHDPRDEIDDGRSRRRIPPRCLALRHVNPAPCVRRGGGRWTPAGASVSLAGSERAASLDSIYRPKRRPKLAEIVSAEIQLHVFRGLASKAAEARPCRES